MIELLLYYIAVLSVVSVSLELIRRQPKTGRCWQLSPTLVLILGYGCYTSAMPVSRILFRTDVQSVDIEFLQAHLLGALGMFLGCCWYSMVAERPSTATVYGKTPRRSPHCHSYVRVVLICIIAFLAVCLYIVQSVGEVAKLAGPYRLEEEILRARGATTFDTLLLPSAISVLIYGFRASQLDAARRSRVGRNIVVTLILLLTILLLIRGYRNWMLLLVLPVIGLTLLRHSLRRYQVVVAVFVLYFGFQTVAIVREEGIAKAGSVNLSLPLFDPLRGELATTYNVYKIAAEYGYLEAVEYGKTYTIAFLVNLVPMQLWPERPPSPAGHFSGWFYGTGAPTFGLGFSPVVEAMMNFGRVGILGVFFLWTVGALALERAMLHKGEWGLLCWSAMLPIAINWNRIDWAVSGKIMLIFFAIFWFLDRLLSKVPRRKRVVVPKAGVLNSCRFGGT